LPNESTSKGIKKGLKLRKELKGIVQGFG